MVLLLGFIPQGKEELPGIVHLLGLSHVKQSWVFMLSGLYFLVCLGFVTLRRSRPLTRKNLGFLMNHGGLWIAVAAGSLGAGQSRPGYQLARMADRTTLAKLALPMVKNLTNRSWW